MKNTVKFAIAFFAAIFSVGIANAQTPYSVTGNQANPGVVNISVNIPKAADLRTGGAASGDFGATVTAQSNTNDALSVSLNFADASPNNTAVSAANPFMYATVPVRMRSNADYEVYAFRTGTLSSTAVEDFRASDVGFGVINVVRTGALVSSGSDTVTSGFGSDPISATITNGQPTYSKSLADVPTATTGTKILGGTRISQGGDNTSTNNFNSADLRFSVKPQYYTPGTYTETVKVFIVTP